MALIAGVQAPAGRVMGHAGATIRAGERSAKAKVKALEEAGVTIVNHPSKFGDGMRKLLNRDNDLHPLPVSRLRIPRT